MFTRAKKSNKKNQDYGQPIKKGVKMLSEDTIREINTRWMDMALDYDLPIPWLVDRELKDWQKENMLVM